MLKPHLKCIIRNSNRYYWCATLLNDKFLIIEVDADCNIIGKEPMFRTHDELIEKKARVIGTHDVAYDMPIEKIIGLKINEL